MQAAFGSRRVVTQPGDRGVQHVVGRHGGRRGGGTKRGEGGGRGVEAAAFRRRRVGRGVGTVDGGGGGGGAWGDGRRGRDGGGEAVALVNAAEMFVEVLPAGEAAAYAIAALAGGVQAGRSGVGAVGVPVNLTLVAREATGVCEAAELVATGVETLVGARVLVVVFAGRSD